MRSFNAKKYLQRIRLATPPSPDIEGLKALHKAQHRAIAFENLDIALGRAIDLDPDALVRKLINTQRGGYCFELNGLLLLALQYFGFQARSLLARVHVSGTVTGRGHQVILVELNHSQWIVDTGFGAQTPRAPVPLILNQEYRIDYQTIRLIEDVHYGTIMQSQANNVWHNLYSFDDTYVCQGDIDYGNHFTSTSTDSVFTSTCVAYLPTDEGGVSLNNRTLKKKYQQGKTITDELNDAHYLLALKQYFNIELDANVEQLKLL